MNYSYAHCESDMMMQVNSLFHIKAKPGFCVDIMLGGGGVMCRWGGEGVTECIVEP